MPICISLIDISRFCKLHFFGSRIHLRKAWLQLAFWFAPAARWSSAAVRLIPSLRANSAAADHNAPGIGVPPGVLPCRLSPLFEARTHLVHCESPALAACYRFMCASVMENPSAATAIIIGAHVSIRDFVRAVMFRSVMLSFQLYLKGVERTKRVRSSRSHAAHIGAAQAAI